MNRKQKACILVNMAVIVAMGLYPPWVLEARIGSKIMRLEPGPYARIDRPPIVEEGIYRYGSGLRGRAKIFYTARFIDLYRLGIQYFVVIAVTVGLIVILGDKKVKS